MSAYLRLISVNGSGNGGRVTGTWMKDGQPFTSGTGTPRLPKDDTLQVAIEATGNKPQTLKGYMLIGPAPVVADTQHDASPFLAGPNKNQVCVQVYEDIKEIDGRYSFAPPLKAPDMKGFGARLFELTFVAAAPSGAQWEDDPEFETGN